VAVAAVGEFAVGTIIADDEVEVAVAIELGDGEQGEGEDDGGGC